VLAVLVLAAVADQQDTIRQKMEESIGRQKASIQQQLRSTGFFMPGWFTPDVTPPVECAALPESELDPLIRSAAAKHGVDAAVLRAMMRQESGFRPCAVSSQGAMGLMQLMPDTAEGLKVADVFDAAQNLDAGAVYLKQMLDRFKGNLALALAAYNAGPERIAGKIPSIPETQDYVARILKSLENERKAK
jgi:soluble lytic murein transglycosylase-like protein